MYDELQPIRPYVAPLRMIEPIGEPITDPDDIEEEIAAAEHSASPAIVETHVIGWGYQQIIRCTDEYGESRYYLAR